jgi:hypothetical protein
MTSAELSGIFRRPDSAPDEALSVFYVEVDAWNEAEGFGRRLREFVTAGVKAGLEADFEAEAVSEADVPPWTGDTWAAASRRYAAHRGDEEWTVQDVLFSFDPRQRAWTWWDVTALFGNTVCVWVDSGGEAVFNCEELRWMIYVCGARTVVGPLPRDASEWDKSASLGAKP